MVLNSCNIGTSGLPDMYARGLRVDRQTTSVYVTTICNTLRVQIKGSHREINLIMPSHHGNEDIIQILPGKVL